MPGFDGRGPRGTGARDGRGHRGGGGRGPCGGGRRVRGRRRFGWGLDEAQATIEELEREVEALRQELTAHDNAQTAESPIVER